MILLIVTGYNYMSMYLKNEPILRQYPEFCKLREITWISENRRLMRSTRRPRLHSPPPRLAFRADDRITQEDRAADVDRDTHTHTFPRGRGRDLSFDWLPS